MHTSEADATTQTAPPPKPKWAFARQSFACGRCQGLIGHGEAYRVPLKTKRWIGICADCSIAMDPENGAIPDHIDDRSQIEELRDSLAKPALSRPPDFARFTTPAARAAWKREAKAKPNASMQWKPGSQPYEDPRGQGRNRHGVADAMRKNIEEVDLDWRKRQAGERDE